MGLLSRKNSSAGMSDAERHQPHDYKAPAQPPSSGHVACQICGRTPEDTLHDVPKNAVQSDMHWS
jgi:hypothetical protein